MPAARKPAPKQSVASPLSLEDARKAMLEEQRGLARRVAGVGVELTEDIRGADPVVSKDHLAKL